MQEPNEPEMFSEYTDTKANLNYEMLLGRQVDRCLFYRTIDRFGNFFSSVNSLDMGLVDLPGKLLRSEFDFWISNQKDYPNCPRNEEGLNVYDSAFKQITRILSRNHMLFRSILLEVNR